MKKLENKTVFVTGGLSGIGKACAVAAAKEGANVAVADLPNEKAESMMTEIKQLNGQAIFVACDVSDPDSVEKAVAKTIETFGSLDVAVNNAGIGGEANVVGEMSIEGWRKVIEINLSGVFYCMKFQLAQMMKQGSGSIINMASILGKVGFANSSGYAAAKHGVVGLTESAALEYAEKGIRVNALCPGFIATPLLDKGGITSNKEVEHFITEKHAMKRLGKSEEIAAAFMFLASDESSFVTGSSLVVDGGYLAQ